MKLVDMLQINLMFCFAFTRISLSVKSPIFPHLQPLRSLSLISHSKEDKLKGGTEEEKKGRKGRERKRREGKGNKGRKRKGGKERKMGRRWEEGKENTLVKSANIWTCLVFNYIQNLKTNNNKRKHKLEYEDLKYNPF